MGGNQKDTIKMVNQKQSKTYPDSISSTWNIPLEQIIPVTPLP